MTARGLFARIAVPVTLIAAGVTVAVTSDTSLAVGLSAFLVGVGFVIALAAVFLEVGLSEDRQRARDEAAQAPPVQTGASARRSPPRRRGGH